MDGFGDWLKEYWAQTVIGLLVAWFIGSLKLKWSDYKKYKERIKNLEDASRALLHDRIFQACKYYIDKGYITVDGLDNICTMFKPYEALLGNGTCSNLVERCKELPIRDE